MNMLAQKTKKTLVSFGVNLVVYPEGTDKVGIVFNVFQRDGKYIGERWVSELVPNERQIKKLIMGCAPSQNVKEYAF